MMSEESGDAAAPRSKRLTLARILAALVAIGIVGCGQFSGEAQHDAHEHCNRGFAYGKKGDLGRAIADYTKAIDLKPDYAEAYYNRGTAYGKKGDRDRAIADYTKATDLKPGDALAYCNRGIAHYEKGDHDRAVADLTKAIELDPDGPTSSVTRSVLKRLKEKGGD